MGWRFKKPINFGGFRLNLSKRGIGMSWGFPMFRTGISSDGRRYIWITVPRTGLSWVKYFGKGNSSSGGTTAQPTPYPRLPLFPANHQSRIRRQWRLHRKQLLVHRGSNLGHLGGGRKTSETNALLNSHQTLTAASKKTVSEPNRTRRKVLKTLVNTGDFHD
jgi:hypothetical protein